MGDAGGGAGGGAGAALAILLIAAAVYCYFAISLQVMARKTGTPNGWMAWIPILNAYLLCKVGGKPGWWLLLFLIPVISIIFAILVWMGVAEARGKPGWVGILIIVPFVNLFIPGYLAFSD
jgi:hypothetical protein